MRERQAGWLGLALFLGMSLLAGMALFPAVAAAQAKPPQSPAALLSAARLADEAGDDLRVIELLRQWQKAQPPPRTPGELVPMSAEAAEAFFLLGKALAGRQQTGEAVGYLKKLLKEAPDSPWTADANALLGQLHEAQGATVEAIGYFEKAAGLQRTPELRRPLLERLSELYRKAGNLPKAVETLLTLRRLAEASDDQATALALTERIDGIIAAETDPARLGRLIESKRYPADAALLRLAALAAERRESYDEEQWLKRFLADFPKHPLAGVVADRLRTNVTAIKAKSTVVGVVLPLSGPARLFGRSALRGAQVALEGVEATVGVAVRDSQELAAKPPEAAEALERWAREFDPVAVIGPLLNREMRLMAPAAERLRLPMLNPGAPVSADLSASGTSEDERGYLFWNGLTLAEQARTVADYAVTSRGLLRFMIFYPDAPYARAVVEIFANQVRQGGGEVIATIGYPPDSTDFNAQLKALKSADLARYGTIGPPVEGQPPDKWPYTRGFDAIFLPGGAEAGGMIASQLAFHGYEELPLLGVGDWNRPELFTFGGRFVDGAVVADGFFAKSDAPHVKDFVRRYQLRYHEEPDLFAAQAYDAMRMVISAIEQGASDGGDVRDYLSGIKRYPGVSGLTTLVPGGPAQKLPYLLQARNGKWLPIEWRLP